MTNESIPIHNPETIHHTSETTAALGSKALLGAEEMAGDMRTTTVGNVVCMTDLPAGFEPTPADEYADPANMTFPVSQLDALPHGNYQVTGSRMRNNEYFEMVPIPFRKTIETSPHNGGTVVNAESMGYGNWRIQPDSTRLMEALGYRIADQNGEVVVDGVPTPATVKEAARKLGVDIHFFEDADIIPGDQYLGVIAAGKYPASYGEYKHDIEDDHLTAVVLGAEPLRDALAQVASASLKGEGLPVNQAALRIDQLTAVLRAVISSHSEFQGEEFGTQKGRQSFMVRAAEIGIAHDQADAILRTAQANAKAYGLDVKELE